MVSMFLAPQLCAVFLVYTINISASTVPYNNGTAVRVIQASTTSCGGCQMHEAAFEFNWYTEILTHTAATVIFAIDNSTNITKTKAIEAGTLPIPYSLGFNLRSTISGSLFSTIVGGITYTLTYPTAYMGIGGVDVASSYPVTNSGGAVSCVTTHINLPGWMINVSNSPSKPLSSYDTCTGDSSSPPQFLLRVSSLTASSTTYVRPQATSSKILPSPTLGSPTVLATKISGLSPSLSGKSTQPSTTVSSQPPNYSVAPSETSILITMTSNESMAGLVRPAQSSLKTVEIKVPVDVVPNFHTPETSIIAPETERRSSEPPQTDKMAKSSTTALAEQATHISAQDTAQRDSSSIETSGSPAYPSRSLSIGNSVLFLPSGSNPLSPMSTVISGLADSTISDTPISLMPSASRIVIYSNTSSLVSPSHNDPVMTIGSSVYTANEASDFVIDGQTLASGSVITLSDTRISLDGPKTVVAGQTGIEAAGLGALIMSAFGPADTSPLTATDGPKLPNLPPTLPSLTVDNLTISMDASKMILSGTTDAIGTSATPTTVVAGNETLILGPSGAIFPFTTITAEATPPSPSAAAFTGGARSDFKAKDWLLGLLSSAVVLLILKVAVG